MGKEMKNVSFEMHSSLWETRHQVLGGQREGISFVRIYAIFSFLFSQFGANHTSFLSLSVLFPLSLALERVPVNRHTQESLSVLSGSQLPTANSNESKTADPQQIITHKTSLIF